jgi:hypothetical protein
MLVKTNNTIFETVVFEEVAGSTAYIFVLRNGEHRKFAEKGGTAISPDEIPAECWDFLQLKLAGKSAGC